MNISSSISIDDSNNEIDYDGENQEEPKTRKRSSATINIDDFDQKTKTKINFNSFEILELIGGGSFGKVYKVKQKNTGNIHQRPKDGRDIIAKLKEMKRL